MAQPGETGAYGPPGAARQAGGAHVRRLRARGVLRSAVVRQSQVFDERLCGIACVGNGRVERGSCGVDGHCVHQGHPRLRIVHARPLPTRPCAPPANPSEPPCSPEGAEHRGRRAAPVGARSAGSGVVTALRRQQERRPADRGIRVHTSTSCSIIPGSSRAAQTSCRARQRPMCGAPRLEASVAIGGVLRRRSADRCPPTVAAAQSATSRSARHAARRWVTVSAGLSLGSAWTSHGPVEADCLVFECAKIYVSQSRHWDAVRLRFLS